MSVPMAVKVVWVLTSVGSNYDNNVHHHHYDTPDECQAAAIQAVENGGAKFSFCTEGYADPLQYLPYPRS